MYVKPMVVTDLDSFVIIHQSYFGWHACMPEVADTHSNATFSL